MRLALLFLSLLVGKAMACGYCVEDKIAAVYDYATLTRAAAHHHTVAYFAIDGAIRDSRQRLASLAESASGVQKGSARVSVEAAALAVTFDPRRTTLAGLARALEQKLRSRGLRLLILDTMDGPAGFDGRQTAAAGKP